VGVLDLVSAIWDSIKEVNFITEANSTESPTQSKVPLTQRATKPQHALDSRSLAVEWHEKSTEMVVPPV